ncbi:MAG: hypothetical protein MZW92_81695 [Comamonadaceae bacterium]|nr:hypothetical protein [Comamonadaceae bacterium]
MGVLDDEARSATVMAVTPSVLVVLAKADFKRCLKENFDVTHYVMRKLIQRLRMADRRIESLALLDVAGRVVRVLRDTGRDAGRRAGGAPQAFQAGHRQDGRRLARDGEPGRQGPGTARADRRERRAHRLA